MRQMVQWFERRTSDVRREVAFLVSNENSKCSPMQDSTKLTFMVDAPCFLTTIIIYFHSHLGDFTTLFHLDRGEFFSHILLFTSLAFIISSLIRSSYRHG